MASLRNVPRWLGLTKAQRGGGGWFPVGIAAGGTALLVAIAIFSPETMSARFWWMPHLMIGVALVCILITLIARR